MVGRGTAARSGVGGDDTVNSLRSGFDSSPSAYGEGCINRQETNNESNDVKNGYLILRNYSNIPCIVYLYFCCCIICIFDCMLRVTYFFGIADNMNPDTLLQFVFQRVITFHPC